MAGRKLTRAQTERVRASHARRAERLAARDTVDGDDGGEEERGRVVARFGKEAEVECARADAPTRVRCRIRATVEGVVTGDDVAFRRQPDDASAGVIVTRLPRRNELLRPDNYGKLKAVAANIDRVLVVFAPLPAPSAMLLDRYLAACEASGLTAVLVLNKADTADAAALAFAQELLALYRGIGYEAIACSAKRGEGVDALQAALAGRTGVLVGQSGVGKSSLVNALLPEANLHTQEVSDVSGLGQHTTTSARLFHLPGGGELIDSPGVREFQLWHVDEETLERAFTDFRAFRGQCRFRDCRHLREPGCALRAAVERGELAASRLENFLRIREALKEGPTRGFT